MTTKKRERERGRVSQALEVSGIPAGFFILPFSSPSYPSPLFTPCPIIPNFILIILKLKRKLQCSFSREILSSGLPWTSRHHLLLTPAVDKVTAKPSQMATQQKIPAAHPGGLLAWALHLKTLTSKCAHQKFPEMPTKTHLEQPRTGNRAGITLRSVDFQLTPVRKPASKAAGLHHGPCSSERPRNITSSWKLLSPAEDMFTIASLGENPRM